MKNIKLYLLVCFAMASFAGKTQITLENTHAKLFWLDKFHISGYKYVEPNYATQIINIYNINHTLYKSFPIPPLGSSYSSINIGYVSEQLFNLDTLIEYTITYLVDLPNHNKVFIYNELGATLFYRDSGSVYQHQPMDANAFYNGSAIYFNGIGTKMTVQQGANTTVKWEVYDLPGTIPCVECSAGIITDLAPADEDLKKAGPVIYPNPTSGELKLNYKLPQGCNKAQILIFDINGKQVKEYTITDTFMNILLPAEFNNGTYLYSLKVNNEIIKTEKIILEK